MRRFIKFISSQLILWTAVFGLAGESWSSPIDEIAATDWQLKFDLDGTPSGQLRLLELPPYPLTQNWTLEGDGGVWSLERCKFEFGFTTPAGAFDPSLSNNTVIDADNNTQFAIRLKLTNAPNPFRLAVYSFPFGGGTVGVLGVDVTPTGDWQTVRLDLSNITVATWEGFQAIRLDFADAAPDATPYLNTTVEVDWISVTDDPAFDYYTSTWKSSDKFWRFRYDVPVFEGAYADSITINRFEDQHDRLYSKFQFVDPVTGDPLGDPRYVTNLDSLSRVGADMQGWHKSGEGNKVELVGNQLHVTYYEPSSAPFDPIIQNSRLIDADTHQYLYMYYRMENAPSSVPCGIFSFGPLGDDLQYGEFSIIGDDEWHTLKLDMTAVQGSGWNGLRSIRIDAPNGLVNIASYLSARLRIGWIAFSDNPDFDVSSPASDDAVWDFHSDRNYDFPKPETRKGLLVDYGYDDAEALGAKTAVTNMLASPLIDLTGNKDVPDGVWVSDGIEFPVNEVNLGGLDRIVREETRRGMKCWGIMLNGVPNLPDPTNPFIHPLTDLANTPFNLGAFNLTDEQGYRHYRAVMEMLAHRYTDPDLSFGQLQGIVIGNEIQSHWWWHNMSDVSQDTVAEQYELSLRIADLAFRKSHAKFLAYSSLEHHWTSSFTANPLQSTDGKSLLENIHTRVKARGDFPWGLAFHPYPENLLDPEFWYDTSTPFSFNAGKITFDNLEVLPQYLSQEEFLFEGERRSIILSEQGFHTLDQPDGEQIQAAAYAYSWHKIREIPGIDAYMLFRQHDYSTDDVFLPGIWTATPGEINTPNQKKYIWDVFRQADTPAWESAFAFALPIIGASDWDALMPAWGEVDFFFDTDGDFEGWSAVNQITGETVSAGTLSATASDGDPFFEHDNFYLYTGLTDTVLIRQATTAGDLGQLFWGTDLNPSFAGERSQTYPLIADGEYHFYLLDLEANAEWAQKIITGLRLDPTQHNPGATFTIDYIVGGPAGDFDRDGLSDSIEGLDDIDNDGRPNLYDLDSDGDGYDDADEAALGTDPYDPASYPQTNPETTSRYWWMMW